VKKKKAAWTMTLFILSHDTAVRGRFPVMKGGRRCILYLMARILLIEDHKETAAAVCLQLSREGHDPVHVETGDVGLEHLLMNQYDLAIIDWQLPGISGLEICERYRAADGHTPIMMLTGRGELKDKIDGLDTGADDYVTKPFSLKELASRVRALLRRPPAVVSDVLVLGPLRLDPVNHLVYLQQVEIDLMPRDFALLEFLMRNPNVVFSSEALIKRVWSDEAEVGPDALRTAIKRIRKKIDVDDAGESIIENVPRLGYRLRVR
jgi:DNA-binding response OmpR family regulator